MNLQQGINFRQTLGFIDDGSYEYAELGQDLTYPTTTAQGNTVGIEQIDATVAERDRTILNDRRLAGCAGCIASGFTYRIDIRTTGNKNVRMAAGDSDYAHGAHIELFDTNDSLGVLADRTNSAANCFTDATNTEYAAADWPTGNTAVVAMFATTILRFKLFSVAGDETNIAHFYVEDGPDMGITSMLGAGCA